MRVVLLTLVLVYGITVVNSSSSGGKGGKGGKGSKGSAGSKGSSSTDSVSERKKRFAERARAAIENEPDLDTSDVDEYTEYVSAYDKLDRLLDNKDGCNLTRNYRAYERNKRRINELNANAHAKATHFEVVNGRVFNESYAVNEFADCDDDCRKEYLLPAPLEPLEQLEQVNPSESDPNRRHRRQRRHLQELHPELVQDTVEEWDLNPNCIELDQDYFADVNADATVQDSMWSDECGAVKNQGRLGTCWAFAATAQFQCNFNAAHQEKPRRVFSEKYGTDCSDDGSVTEGMWQGYLEQWYTDNGACSDYYKAYDESDSTDYDGDCDCNAEKAYGQCYRFSPSKDAKGKLAIANAAQLYALSFSVALCTSFFDLSSRDAVWYGCGDDEEILGYHAMTIVGQDMGRYVLVRNSWGTGIRCTGVTWGSQSEPGHVWFHSDVWSSKSYWHRGISLSFNYFRPQPHSEHEAPTAKCHAQGPCDSGFMDTSDGAYTRDVDNCSPAADCAGGDYVDSECNCVCQAAGTCDDEDEHERIGACPLVSSGFDDSSFNGHWTYSGEHNVKAYYQHAEYFVAYNGFEYMLTDDLRSGSAYCNCGAKELSQCEWYCWDGDHASATVLESCDSSCVCAPIGEEEKRRAEVDETTCPLVSSGFDTNRNFDGQWMYEGEYDGKPYYRQPDNGWEGMQSYYIAYNQRLDEYLLAYDLGSVDDEQLGGRYCTCGANELSECTWDCGYHGDASRATTVHDCDMLWSNESPPLLSITTHEALALAVALLIGVNFCVAMEIMRRRIRTCTGTCRKTSYAKVQMVEDSEAEAEAEQILQVSN